VIHLYKFKDLNILLDVNSGAVHIVSDLVRDILSFFDDKDPCACKAADWHAEKAKICAALAQKYPDKALEDAMDDVETLISEGSLFTEDTPEASVSPESRGAVIKAMCLHAAHDCNMRCAYCFAGTGDYAGKRALLSLETGKKAIDFLIRQSGNRKNLEIDFFGGEPLMNFEVVKELVRYGRTREQLSDKHIRFTLTTNGLLLDADKEHFINAHMDNVILSIDGRPEVNDRMRKTPSCSGTEEHIIGKLTHITENRDGLY
jgi:uncharacterized protein